MTGSKISRRYAKALLSIGQEDGQYETYGENLREFAEVCTAHEVFFKVISNQLFSVEDRKKILEVVLAKSTFSDVVKNFLRLLVDKNRIAAVPEVTDYYARLTDEISNITRASVITARPIKDDALDSLVAALKSLTAKDVKAEVAEDTSLIGGLVVRIGDLVLDGSVKTQLAGLTESLKRGGYN